MVELWYTLISLLPFEWAEYTFMKNALLAVLIITPMFGIIGTMVVNNRMAFFSDSIGHSALAGIGLGVILNFKDSLMTLIVFSILMALIILAIKNMNRASTDTIIGAISSAAVAGGIIILSKGGGFGKYSVFLIGDILSIKTEEILLIIAVFFIVVIFWLLFYNRLLIASTNQSLAKSRGLHTQVIEAGFFILISVVVAVSIQWVGILIISSLMVIPAAASRNIAGSVRNYHIFAILISMFSGVSGLMISYYGGSAAGATIVMVSFVIYVLTILFRKIKG